MKKEEPVIMTNRKWQKHFKAKGFIPFIYDRLLSYAVSRTTQYSESPFNFDTEKGDTNPLLEYFNEFIEEFPYVIFIEFTNRCNLNCSFCARKNMTRPMGNMSMQTYKKIIDEIAIKRPFAQIHLYGIGESIMDPTALEKIRYAMDKGLRNLIIFSNGKDLLKNDYYKKLVDTGIPCIGIDVDGMSKEIYEKIRVGADFKNLKKAVEDIHKYVRSKKLNTRIEVTFQMVKGVNDHEFPAFVKWCNDNDYEYKVTPMHQWIDLRKDIETINSNKGLKRTEACRNLLQGFMILWNGDVALCFSDADGRELMGNVNNASIKEIWDGKCKEKRIKHSKGIFDGLCENCEENI